jgi:predicted RNA-binding protein with RPS1 domain
VSIYIGQSYTFKVILSENNYSIIVDPFGVKHYYNKPLLRDQEICLLVSNKIEGKFHFKEIVEFGDYEVGKVYDFSFDRVDVKIHELNTKHTVFVVKDKKNNEHQVLPFFWQIHPEYVPPDTLVCRVVSTKYDSTSLKQIATSNLLHPFYKLNEIYEFDFLEIKQITNNEGRKLSKIILRGIDDFKYSSLLLFGQRYEELINKKIKCRFDGYYPSGDLKLRQMEKPVISFEVVTETIDYDNINSFREKAFYDFKNSDDNRAQKMFEDYDNGENIWVFSYCELIQSKIFQLIDEFNFSEVIYFVNIIVSVEEWILKSGFLNTFRPEKREINRQTAKSKIEQFSQMLPALKLLVEIKGEDYLNAIIQNEVTISEDSLTTAFNIIRFSDKVILSNHLLFEYLKFCGQGKYYTPQTWGNFLLLLGKRKQALRKEIYIKTSIDLDDSLKPKYDKNKIWEIIELTIIEVLINRDLNDSFFEIKNLSILLKQLAYYVVDEDKKNDLIVKSLQVISFPKFSSLISDDLNWNELVAQDIIDKITNVCFTTPEFEEIKSEIAEKHFNNSCLNVKIQYCSKGIYLVSYKELSGFVPKNHILKTMWSKLKPGFEITIKILLLDNETLNFIGTGLINDLDSILEKKNGDRWDQLYLPPHELYDIEDYKKNILKSFSVDQIVSGKVKAFENYGAFVDLGDIDGLLHISDISWKIINHPSEELNIGQEIECLVTKLDGAKNTISLSLKSLKSKPWELLDNKLEKDSYVEVKVINRVDYGFFVELKCGVRGLLHKSEIPLENFKGEQQYKFGDRLRVKIDTLDRSKKQISFTNPELITEEKNNIYTFEDKELDDDISDLEQDGGMFRSRAADIGFNYEYCAFLKKELKELIDKLNWAAYYYNFAGVKRLHLIKHYIKYFRVIQKFELDEDIEVVNKFSAVFYNQLENDFHTLTEFPALKKLAKYIRVLSLFNSNSIDNYKFLSEISINENGSYHPDEVRLAKLILSNNLLISEQYDENLIANNRNTIIKYMKEGIFQLQEPIVQEPDENEIQKQQEETELRNLIARGENNSVEFKSTLRVCLEGKRSKRYIEHQSFKVIAAFLNSGGGDLLIGIKDDKSILGLEKDFATFTKENKKDEFRKHFDNLIEVFLKNQFSNYIELDFIEIDDKLICKVHMKAKPKEPVILKYEGKEEFWIRRTGSNKQLSFEEFWNYNKDY